MNPFTTDGVSKRALNKAVEVQDLHKLAYLHFCWQEKREEGKSEVFSGVLVAKVFQNKWCILSFVVCLLPTYHSQSHEDLFY